MSGVQEDAAGLLAQTGDVRDEAAGLTPVAHAMVERKGQSRSTTDDDLALMDPGLLPHDPHAKDGSLRVIEGVDLWGFRRGLIWRYRAIYDFTDLGR